MAIDQETANGQEQEAFSRFMETAGITAGAALTTPPPPASPIASRFRAVLSSAYESSGGP